MPTEHQQVINTDWVTYLDADAPNTSRVDTPYSVFTPYNRQKPFMHFTDTPFSGTIQSGTLSFYLFANPTASLFNVYRVNRAANSAATWASTGLGAWSTAGCGDQFDHSAVPMIVNTTTLSEGWNHLTVTDLSELRLLIDGLDMVVFQYISDVFLSDHYIVKSFTPYLTVNYTTSLLGGVQIF
jgi:hypothetical protein